MTMEPVFAAVLAVVVAGEMLSPPAGSGACSSSSRWGPPRSASGECCDVGSPRVVPDFRQPLRPRQRLRPRWRFYPGGGRRAPSGRRQDRVKGMGGRGGGVVESCDPPTSSPAHRGAGARSPSSSPSPSPPPSQPWVQHHHRDGHPRARAGGRGVRRGGRPRRRAARRRVERPLVRLLPHRAAAPVHDQRPRRRRGRRAARRRRRRRRRDRDVGPAPERAGSATSRLPRRRARDRRPRCHRRRLAEELARRAGDRIIGVLEVDRCRFVPDAVPPRAAPVLRRDGSVHRDGVDLAVEREGLPTDVETWLAAPAAHGYFRITAASRVARPTREQRRVAVLLAAQFAAGAPGSGERHPPALTPPGEPPVPRSRTLAGVVRADPKGAGHGTSW